MTSPRLRRLRSDFSQVQKAFASDNHVIVEPQGKAEPPETYEVTYNVRGLRRVDDHPEFVDTHRVEVRLPVGYPAEQPYCVPLTPVFHPNVQEYFCTADHWSPDTSLVDVIVRLGEMIQWRDFNPESPLDAEAAKWARDHSTADFLPVGDVDLHRTPPAKKIQAESKPAKERIKVAPNAENGSESDDENMVVVRSK